MKTLYLNLIKKQRTHEFIDDVTTIPVDDERVAKYFQTPPKGFKTVLNVDTYIFEEIPPLNEDGTVNFKGNRLEELAKDEGDEYFKYYNLTPDGEGIYQEDTAKSSQDVKDKRIVEIDVLLAGIDMKKVRPLSELIVESTPETAAILNGLNAEAKDLRDERKLLEGEE